MADIDIDRVVERVLVLPSPRSLSWTRIQTRGKFGPGPAQAHSSISLSSTRLGRDQDYVDVQQRLFERLGTFKNLRILKFERRATFLDGSLWTAPERVGLRLETGLDKLGGLKEFEGLHMIGIWRQMGVGVGVQETEWMVQQWLRLSRVVDLNQGTEAFDWLRENHPEFEWSDHLH